MLRANVQIKYLILSGYSLRCTFWKWTRDPFHFCEKHKIAKTTVFYYCQHECLIPINYIITLFIADVVAYI